MQISVSNENFYLKWEKLIYLRCEVVTNLNRYIKNPIQMVEWYLHILKRSCSSLWQDMDEDSVLMTSTVLKWSLMLVWSIHTLHLYIYTFFMYAWSQVEAPSPRWHLVISRDFSWFPNSYSYSALVLTEYFAPFLPWDYVLNYTAHWHRTERNMGLLARQPDNWIPHGAS